MMLREAGKPAPPCEKNTIATFKGDAMPSVNGRPRAILFDLDDTLIDNHFKYLEADIAALRIVFKALGTQAPEPGAILRRADEIDRHMVEIGEPAEKFVLERFPTAWVRAYEELCAENGARVRPGIRERVYRAAFRAFRPPFPLVPFAKATLEKLRRRGFVLHLVTLGVDAHQRAKIVSTGLEPLFESITVTVCDKEKALAAHADRYGAEATVMVGNSLRSDINPALRLGLHAVHIPRSTWSREWVEPVSGDYHRLEDIRRLPALLERMGPHVSGAEEDGHFFERSKH
jgi:putative hydrolase of the HAD superfamily